MKKSWAMKWADALESGKFKKTKHVLYDGKGYCCLGVACVIAGLKPEKLPEGIMAFDGYDADLPLKVRKKFRIKSSDGTYGDGGCCLMDDNDYGRKSFKAIAKIIRERWQEL